MKRVQKGRGRRRGGIIGLPVGRRVFKLLAPRGLFRKAEGGREGEREKRRRETKK